MKKLKKILLLGLLLILVSSVTPALGQESYNRVNDIIGFGGVNAQAQNLNSWGYFYGLYLDYLPVKSANKHWTGGIFLMANHSWYLQNLQQYTGQGLQVVIGTTVGYYTPKLSSRSQLFIGVNLGLMYSQTDGKSSTRKGDYRRQQRDEILYSNINFNILSKRRLFVRSQLIITGEFSLLSGIKAYWNEKKLLDAYTWNMSYYEALFKESIANIPMKNWRISPKIIGLYSFSAGNSEKNYGIGGELALHRAHKDSFLSLYYLYKFSSINPEVASIGLVINLSNYKKNIN